MSDTATSILERAAHGPDNSANPRPDRNQLNPVPSLVRELFDRARETRRPLLQQWRRNYRALHNRDYHPGDNPWDEHPAIAQIFPTIASATAWMTDQRTQYNVTPTAEAFSEYWDFYNQLAGDLNTCLDANWTVNRADAEVSKVLWDIYTYGVGYYKTEWCAPLADGLGDARFRRVDPWTVYPDPFARNVEDVQYIIEARTMTIADADRAWPGAAKLLRDNAWDDDIAEAPTRTDDNTDSRRNRMALGPITAGGSGQAVPSNVPGNQTRLRSGHKFVDSPVITVLECYVRDTTATPATDNREDNSDDEVMHVHDDWHCYVVSGNVVLVDRPCSDMYAFPTHPYDRQVLFDIGEWYGPCITELLVPIQRLINWLLGAIVRNIYLIGNPQIAEAPSAASSHHRISNRPGQRIPTHPSNIAWMNPPQMHPNMSTDLIVFLKSEIESITGLSAMVRGFAPQGRNSQGVIDSVQDAAFVRVRAALHELERTLGSVGQKMAATIAEFYTEPRTMSLVGPDGRTTHMSLGLRHFYTLDSDSGESVPLRFSITADAGSSLPTSKQARSAEAKHLFELGVIDEYETLKAQNWPNYALVAQRVMESKAAAATQAAMAGK